VQAVPTAYFLACPEKNTENFSENTWCPGGHSTQVLPEYKSDALLLI
jgi:hypothetical protein